ncbi:MAG: 4Fe-4S binding protein [Candidatus Thorarchaeota archaeon]|nr:4Fe-4S binding protein [Candidatus Thorarchaeota archaeon]
MADDADKLDKTEEERDLEQDEKVKKPTTEPPKETKSRRGNLVGIFFNVRMLRRLVQIFFFVGINAYILASWTGGEALLAFWQAVRTALPTLPIIAPLEAPFAAIAGSFDTLQRELTAGAFPFFTLGAMIIILTVLGRAPCAWICPIGTIQDFCTLPKRTKVRPSPNTEAELRRVKGYLFFLVILFAIWMGVSRITGNAANLEKILGIFAQAPFDPFNPAYILFFRMTELNWPNSVNTLWYLMTFGPIAWLQIIFVFLVFAVSFWVPRWFCRWLCPAGWFYGVFSRDSLIGIGRNPARCTPDTCNVCEVVCPMNIRIRRFPYQHMYSPDCIMCLECKSHCPNKAIQIRFS